MDLPGIFRDGEEAEADGACSSNARDRADLGSQTSPSSLHKITYTNPHQSKAAHSQTPITVRMQLEIIRSISQFASDSMVLSNSTSNCPLVKRGAARAGSSLAWLQSLELDLLIGSLDR